MAHLYKSLCPAEQSRKATNLLFWGETKLFQPAESAGKKLVEAGENKKIRSYLV
jgi:hypothetical protein